MPITPKGDTPKGDTPEHLQNAPMQRAEVYSAFDSEREYQLALWGDKPQSVGAFITMLDVYVEKAKKAWIEANHDRDALDVIRKIGGIVTACGEQHGLPFRE